ncbi:MAG: heme exporter protein CcmD [Gammaproteobacteria bacterium]|nr:heme exporter protein CcmD [Gammaproteobacteria bacterium]
MGGVYTTYLLIAYGVTTVVVIGNLLAARRQFRRTRDRLRQQLERRSGRRPAATSGSAP